MGSSKGPCHGVVPWVVKKMEKKEKKKKEKKKIQKPLHLVDKFTSVALDTAIILLILGLSFFIFYFIWVAL